MIKHSQSTQSNKFVISLECLKNEVRNEVQFLHAINIKTSTNWIFSFLMKVARHDQSTQNKKFVKFL